MSVFYGLIMKANFKYTQFVSRAFHVSSVALDNGGHAKVYLTYENKQFLMATMSKKVPQVALDLNFSPGDRLVFNVEGDGKVSMMGYIYNPQPDSIQDGEEGIKEAGIIQQSQQLEQQQLQQQQEQRQQEQQQQPQQLQLPRARKTGPTCTLEDIQKKADDDDDEADDDDEDDDDEEDDDDDDDDDEDEDNDEDENEVPKQVAKGVAKIVAACEPVVADHCQNSHRCHVEAVQPASSSMVGKPRAIRSAVPEYEPPKLCKYHTRMCVKRAKRNHRDTSPEGSCQWKRYKDCYYP